MGNSPWRSGTWAYRALTSYVDDDTYGAVLLQPGRGHVAWWCVRRGAVREVVLGALAGAFSACAYHQLLVWRAGGALEATLDGVVLSPLVDPLSPERPA